MTWIDLIAKPEWAPAVPRVMRDVLDTLQDVLPIENNGDRFVSMSKWLQSGLENGLITTQERSALRAALAQVM